MTVEVRVVCAERLHLTASRSYLQLNDVAETTALTNPQSVIAGHVS
jgi:hypothetical protein